MSASSLAHAPLPPRQRFGGERTAERILDAAEELFAERGYHGTTLRDVATLAEVIADAIVRAARQATGVQGIPALRDLK